MKEDNNHNNRQQPAGAGRVSNIDGTERGRDQSRDISSIDRQEGEMDNGETGGNFQNQEKDQEIARKTGNS